MKKEFANPNDYVFMFDELVYVNQIDTLSPTGFDIYWLTIFTGIQDHLRTYNSTISPDREVIIFERELCLLHEQPL
jgi:hypothetical protein